jgi:hypothetical protein
LLPAGIGTEAPQRDQRADGRIKGSVAAGSHLQRAGQHLGKLAWQRERATGVGAVETADQRIGLPGAHLHDDFVQSGMDAVMQGAQVAARCHAQAHAPRRAHAVPPEGGNGLRLIHLSIQNTG